MLIGFNRLSTHRHQSVSYLNVLNLPRYLHYKCENVILVGIIPGPHEPKSINSFLKPLVDEPLILWSGKIFPVNTSTGIKDGAPLLCVSCDLPAA